MKPKGSFKKEKTMMFQMLKKQAQLHFKKKLKFF